MFCWPDGDHKGETADGDLSFPGQDFWRFAKSARLPAEPLNQ